MVLPDQSIFIGNGYFDHPTHREKLLAGRNFIGLSCAGHTLEFYRSLPYGWRTTPDGIPTDLYMWQQFLTQSNCRAVSGNIPTVIGLAQALRKEATFDQRLEELARWERIALAPDAERKLFGMAMRSLVLRRAELEQAYTKHRSGIEAQSAAIQDLQRSLTGYEVQISGYKQTIADQHNAWLAAQAELKRFEEQLEQANQKIHGPKDSVLIPNAE